MRSSSGDEEEGESREHSKEETYWKRVFNQNRRRFPEVVKRQVKIFMVLLIIQVSLLDPLFFYIPVIDGRQKCVRLDEKLGTALMVFRSLIDSFYVIYIIVELHKHFSVVRRTGKYQYTRLGKNFLIDFLAVLPLPQVVILIFIPAMRGSRFLNAMYLLRSVVLCQFVPRSFRAYLFITSGTFGVPSKARVKFSPLIFLLGIDVIGAFWYFLSVERLVQCWIKACKTHVGCVNSFYCRDNIDHTSLKHFCPSDGRKTDFFDFGIFSAALQHRVLEMTFFPKKLVYCFQWSLQNLSGFGQNLQTSTYIWENLFAISMSILGLLLFFLLLGNVQTYMESQRMESQRKEEMEEKKLRAMESIENWPPLEKLSVNLGRDIKKELKYNWEKYTTEEGISLYALPTDLRRRIECEHGSELLEKVKAFKYIDKKLLDDLSKSIELRLFDESECIVKEGKTINDMFFILHGELEADSSLGYIIRRNNIIHHVPGEEVTWDIVFNDPSPSFELQRSTMTIKALTRVHALALPVNKVRDFFHNLTNDLKMSIWRELKFVFLKKVKAFKYIDQNVLHDLSASIQPKLFYKGEYIVEEGKTINEVVFILHGNLEAHSSPDVITPMNILTDSEICGEEVIHDIVFNDRRSSFELCGSTMTVKVHTRVHALVLPVNKVRDFFHSLPDDLKMSLWRELNFVFLKKVKAFKYIELNVLDYYLSASIQPKLFDKGEYIAKAGEIMNDVVFILYGMIEASGFQKINILKHGDICVDEVMCWMILRDQWPSSASFLSNVTLKALTTVHALVLPVHKVRDFLHNLPADLKRSIIRAQGLEFVSL